MANKFATMDGNQAVADVAYQFTEIAAIYPITPSSPMATLTDVWSANGRLNMFGQPVKLTEMQSEAGAIGVVHGSLQAGALTTTYTSSQGLMLMIPTLYRIVGEHLPAVLHVAARTVGTHAMSIFGDHSDVMALRQTGVAMLASGSVQEAADLAAVAHLAALKGRIPFVHFFDGFRTSHELSRIETPDKDRLCALLDKDALAQFRAHALNPEHPMIRNMVQNGDVYFQMREANNTYYDDLPAIVEDYMAKVSAIVGREYHIFNYYGAPDAEYVIIAMGSVSGTVCEVIDWLSARGRKCGFVQVHLYRPFSADAFMKAVPASAKKLAVLDRCKEMGSAGEPLYLDVCSCVLNSGRDLKVVGGRYGLSSKDVDPSQILAVYENLFAEESKNNFTVGIEDDVTHLSLKASQKPDTGNGDTISCKFWGLGGDGTVGANHDTVKILSDYADMYAQAYFEYDAKKSFGTTKSHLRFSKSPIRGSYFVKSADIVACHNANFISQYDLVEEIKAGGKLLLNCGWKEEELTEKLPGKVRRYIAEKSIRLFIIDATSIAQKLGLGSHTNMVLQAAFFSIAGLMPAEDAIALMKKACEKNYYTKGHEVVRKNLEAIDAGAKECVEIAVPESWRSAEISLPAPDPSLPYAVRQFLLPINGQKGDELPVSAFKGYEDGVMDFGMTAYEKRGIAVNIPKWNSSACLQCNMCSLVCPHAVVRPFLLSEDEAAKAPVGFETVAAKGKGAESFRYSLQISDYDCTGCGVCVEQCPAKGKALIMEPAQLGPEKQENWNYALGLSDKGDVFDPYTVKGSQFRQPLIEFSAACAGCGETPYAKLLTQLFGSRIYWANGTGCSQAWGSPTPGIPYTTNKRGFGPAYTNSLFENNAELMLGLYLASNHQRAAQKLRVEKLLESGASGKLKEACTKWLDNFSSPEGSRKAADELIEKLQADGSQDALEILAAKDQLAQKSFWMYGGDGWAYDIGFGGLDHVIASGENLKVFVIDTEVYSNTGGQSSKATPIGAVAQFAAGGKTSRKKDLCGIMKSYGNVYVAQVALGANPAQLIKVLKEAEAYPGPALIVAYTPCNVHGIKAGMSHSQDECKRAVRSGYWNLYHFNPLAEPQLVVDSAAPDMPLEDFLDGEVRYSSLKKTFPENAERLFAIAASDAKKRYDELCNNNI